MFNRSRADADQGRGRAAVILTLADGESMSGHVLAPPQIPLVDLLNSGREFIEFESREREMLLLNKRSIVSIALLGIPRTDQLARAKSGGSFDPHEVLGVDRLASRETVRVAYHTLARLYHPDRFAAIDLPPEMSAYANAMLARINMAYRSLAERSGGEAA